MGRAKCKIANTGRSPWTAVFAAALAIATLIALPMGQPLAGWPEHDAARNRGDHKARIAELKALARDGAAEAQAILCMEYVSGKYIPEDMAAGAKMCRKGAEQGHQLSQYLLGLLYQHGEGVEQDYSLAVKWLSLAAEQGHIDSLTELGRMYRYGDGVKKDNAKALHYLGRAAEGGSAKAQLTLGTMYSLGEGVPKDRSKAMAWFHKAANNGDADAQYMVAMSYAIGLTVDQDLTKALQWFRMAAENGHGEAQFKVGNIYAKGVVVPKDMAEAVKWMRLAALQGVLEAQLELGSIYLGARGVPENLPEAARWYLAAAEQGDVQAQYLIAILNSDGSLASRNYEEAAKWFGKAAAQGHGEAQLQLGFLYQVGRGVPKNAAKAFNLYRRAADQGLAQAQYAVGNAYRTGRGTPKSLSKALEWFYRAAKQDHPVAMYSIGYAHLNGEGITQNEKTAIMWFKRSAVMGDSSAQRTLGVMYAIEYGVEINRIAAYMLLTLAIENEIPDESASGARAEVAKWMTDAEIGKARRLAAAWKPGQDLNLPITPARAGVSAGVIRNIQTLLAELGYKPGPADGVMGQKTVSAIRAFQADSGMPVNGTPTVSLEQSLKMALKEKKQRVAAVAAAPAGPDNPSLEFVASGSGFAITTEGHILTNNHVIKGCVEIWITAEGRAEVLALNKTDDLALLRVNRRFEKTATFRKDGPAPLGADIVVAGYPLQSILSTDLGVTTGVVSALRGFLDDKSQLQISAPVQPGNSGGPVLDWSGNLVGVVVAGLDAIGMAKLTGDVPQNINFAIKSSTVLEFLDSLAAPYSVAPSSKNHSVADIAAAARKFTVRIECWE